jgi:anti-anti-sigma factor
MAGQDDLIADRGLTIHVQRDAERVSLLLEGELDMENAATLDEQLLNAEQSPVAEIVLDLSQLRFIDSSGLKSILIATKRSQEDSNRLGVMAGSGDVARLLSLTAIDQSLKLLD